MIRKLKNILHNNKDSASLQSYDLNSLEPSDLLPSNFQRNNEVEVSSSPVSFIKRSK